MQLESRSVLHAEKPNVQMALIDIKGMTCSKCVDRVERILWREQGVKKVSVSLKRHRAKVSFDRDQTTLQRILKSITFTEIIPTTAELSGEHNHNEMVVHRYEAKLIAQECEVNPPRRNQNAGSNDRR